MLKTCGVSAFTDVHSFAWDYSQIINWLNSLYYAKYWISVAFAEICQQMKLNLSIYNNIKLVFGNSINASVSHLHETNKVSF